jgi:Zn-dependent peptidase ImmA (M78 family)
MTNKVRVARIQAHKLSESCGVRGVPVDVEKIALGLGIRIASAPLIGDLSGMACIRDGVGIIGVNSRHLNARRRFTIAHELGHIKLHRARLKNEVHVDKATLRHEVESDNLDEAAANAFAAELLMPQSILAAALASRAIDLEDDGKINSLARRFDVTVTAMRFRLHMPPI